MDSTTTFALAENAAKALVRAMVAEGWEAARDRFAGLFGSAREAAVAELEQARGEVTGSGGLAVDVEVEWCTRLRRLLTATPAVAGEVRAILDEFASRQDEAGVSNTMETKPSGPVIQAHTIAGGVSAISYSGDHIDFSNAIFEGPVTGTTHA